MNEGLNNTFYPSNSSRSTTGANEISYDKPIKLPSVFKEGFFSIYDNLIQNIESKSPLISNGYSALKNEEIIESLLIT